jgi:multiple sugar transport system substrate-binding protein
LTNIPGGWADLHRKLLANLAAKTAPDVIYGKGYWLHDFAPRGILFDLTKHWERDKDEYLNASPVFFEHVETGSGYNGKVYGLPWGQYWYSLAYNKDLFAEAGLENPPDTWDEFRNYAMKLADPNKKNIWLYHANIH